MTVTIGSIEVDRLPAALKRTLPRYPIPILRLARLAFSEDAQSKGVGKRLIRAAFAMAIDLRERLGCAGILVDAKRDAEGFYSALGFETLDAVEGQLEEKPAPTPMFLPIQEAAEAVKVAPTD